MRRFLLLGSLVAVVAWGGAALAAHPAHGSVHRVSAVSLKASDTAPAPGERVVFRGRVLRADLRYENVVVEHVNGVGGELAKLIGNTAQEVLHKWRPSLERKLLEKGNAAIVKAGDTKEVRLSLTKLLDR